MENHGGSNVWALRNGERRSHGRGFSLDSSIMSLNSSIGSVSNGSVSSFVNQGAFTGYHNGSGVFGTPSRASTSSVVATTSVPTVNYFGTPSRVSTASIAATGGYTNGTFSGTPHAGPQSSNWRATAAAAPRKFGSPVTGHGHNRLESQVSIFSSPGGKVKPSFNAPPSMISANVTSGTKQSSLSPAQSKTSENVQLQQQLVAVDFGMVYITKERTRAGASPDFPMFLSYYPNALMDVDGYYSATLPYMATLTFVLESVPDINFFNQILQSRNHPQAHHVITKIQLPKFFWFSGCNYNRKYNPYLVILNRLPSLAEVSITMHAASLTTSVWSERERLSMEEDEFLKSKQLRLHRLQDLLRHYDLRGLLMNRKLTIVKVELIQSDFVTFYTNLGDPTSLFHDLVRWLQNGFSEFGARTHVFSNVIAPQGPAVAT